MRKRALLISSPGKPGSDDYLAGTKIDIANFKDHLVSPVGGGWQSSEIVHVVDPSLEAVRQQLTLLKSYDYAIVYYTGHGCYYKEHQERYLNINLREGLWANELRSLGPKTLIVLDCCQYVTTGIVKKSFSEEIIRMSRGREPDLYACRLAFESAITAAASGFVECVSCSVGEYSWDSSDLGGFYTSSLFSSIGRWVGDQRYNMATSSQVLTIVSAHSQATEQTNVKSGGKQNPSIVKTRTGPFFPIAVFA